MKRVMLFILVLSSQLLAGQNHYIFPDNQETLYSISGQKMTQEDMTSYADGLYVAKNEQNEATLLVVQDGRIIGYRNPSVDLNFSDELHLDRYAEHPLLQQVLRLRDLNNRSSACQFTVSDVHYYIDQIEESFISKYGNISIDSINSKIEWFHAMADNGNFITEVTSTAAFIPNPVSYNTWLAQTLSEATTTADSIEKICIWVAENFPYGDYDTLSETLSADSIFHRVISGQQFGQCGDYSNFLARLSGSFPSWGTPVVLYSSADTTITHGDGSPSHAYVGFVDIYGSVWCVADPTLGGVVRDSVTGMPLSLTTIKNWLFKPSKADRLTIHKVTSSLLTDGPCLFNSSLHDTIGGMTYYEISNANDIGMTRANWRSFDDPVRFSLAVPYWKKRGFTRMTFMNVYGETPTVYTKRPIPEQFKKKIAKVQLSSSADYSIDGK